MAVPVAHARLFAFRRFKKRPNILERISQFSSPPDEVQCSEMLAACRRDVDLECVAARPRGRYARSSGSCQRSRQSSGTGHLSTSTLFGRCSVGVGYYPTRKKAMLWHLSDIIIPQRRNSSDARAKRRPTGRPTILPDACVSSAWNPTTCSGVPYYTPSSVGVRLTPHWLTAPHAPTRRRFSVGDALTRLCLSTSARSPSQAQSEIHQHEVEEERVDGNVHPGP